jgi:dihydroxyacetone kinase
MQRYCADEINQYGASGMQATCSEGTAVERGACVIRFLYYLFIVKRRITVMVIVLAAAMAAWAMKASVERAVVRNDTAPADQVASVLQRGVLTDWDMCTQFHPEAAGAEALLTAALAARPAVTNGQLDSLGELSDQCARVTVPLTGDRAARARRKAGLPK